MHRTRQGDQDTLGLKPRGLEWYNLKINLVISNRYEEIL